MPRTVWRSFGSKSRSIFSRRRWTSTSTMLVPRVEGVVVDVGEDHGLRDDAPGVAHQVLEQRELPRPQLDLPAGPAHLAGQEVHLDVERGEARGLRRSRRAADEGLHAGEELGEGEGLGEVVVAAGLQAADAVVDGAARAQEQHRASAPRARAGPRRGARPSSPGSITSTMAASGGCGERPLQALPAVSHEVGGEAGLLEALAHELTDRRVVFDHQDAHGPGDGSTASAVDFHLAADARPGTPGTTRPPG